MKLISNYEYENEIFSKDNEEIRLTPMEAKVMKLLATKNIVKFKELEEEVFRGKNFTRPALRNLIASIRKKSCQELIKNESKVGYSFNRE